MVGVRRALVGGLAALGVGVVALGAISAVQSGNASAQDSTAPAATAPDKIGPSHGGRPGFGRGFGIGGGEFVADLAAELGITEDELRAALEAVSDQRLEDAVANGDLTQEQLDNLRARRAEVEAAIANGTLEELMRGDVAEHLAPRLADLVERGALTQAQADQLLQALADGTFRETLEEFDLPGLGRGGFGHFKGGGGEHFRFEFRGFGPGDGTGFGSVEPVGSST